MERLGAERLRSKRATYPGLQAGGSERSRRSRLSCLAFLCGAFYLTNAGCENQASGLLFDKFGLPVVAASPPRKNRSENVSDWAKPSSTFRNCEKSGQDIGRRAPKRTAVAVGKRKPLGETRVMAVGFALKVANLGVGEGCRSPSLQRREHVTLEIFEAVPGFRLNVTVIHGRAAQVGGARRPYRSDFRRGKQPVPDGEMRDRSFVTCRLRSADG